MQITWRTRSARLRLIISLVAAGAIATIASPALGDDPDISPLPRATTPPDMRISGIGFYETPDTFIEGVTISLEGSAGSVDLPSGVGEADPQVEMVASILPAARECPPEAPGVGDRYPSSVLDEGDPGVFVSFGDDITAEFDDVSALGAPNGRWRACVWTTVRWFPSFWEELPAPELAAAQSVSTLPFRVSGAKRIPGYGLTPESRPSKRRAARAAVARYNRSVAPGLADRLLRMSSTPTRCRIGVAARPTTAVVLMARRQWLLVVMPPAAPVKITGPIAGRPPASVLRGGRPCRLNTSSFRIRTR